MRRSQLVEYLIDCQGYSEEDLKDKTKRELKDLVDDWQSLQKFVEEH